MRWPLRYQIVLAVMVVVLITLAATTYGNAILATRRTQESINQQLQGVVETLSEDRFPSRFLLSDTVLRQMSGLTGAEFAATDRSDRVVATSLEETPPLDTQKLVRVVSVEQARTVDIDDRPYYQLAVKLDRQVIAEDDPSVLHIFYPQERYRQAISDAVIPPVLVGSFAFLFCLLVSFQIASRITRPIRSFRDQLHDLVRGDFQPIKVPNRNDELRDLIISINELGKLLAAYESDVRSNERLRTLGQLGAGMAHQLRNSVTGCQLALDLHANECPHSKDETWEVANQQLTLMEEYLNRFLALGRLDGAPRKVVDLRKVLEEAVSLTRPMASHAQVNLTFDRPEQVARSEGDHHALCQMIINLVINAIEAASKHAALVRTQDNSGGSVEVSLRRETDDTWLILVSDTGEGPKLELAEQLFDPLITDKPEGTGLGLSVARDVAKAHHGSINWNRANDRTCFTVSLPAKDESTDGDHSDH